MTMQFLQVDSPIASLSFLVFGLMCCYNFFGGANNFSRNIWYHAREDDINVNPDVPGYNYFDTRLATTIPGYPVLVHDNELEALNTLEAAEQMGRLGRDRKAERLFRHALSLSPRQPAILVGYGEFLERSAGDITAADQLYERALWQSPYDERALVNRRRTSPLVEQADWTRLDRVDRKLRRLSRVPHTSAALRRIKKEAYFQQIHHSSGIEGNTLSLAETRFVLETRLAVAGKSVAELNEILGLDAAIKFINNTLVNRLGSVRLQDILQIHRHVMGHVDPLEAGVMRTSQVFVGQHRPPPPAKLPALMTAFVDWLNDPDSLSLHPVKFAALAHYKLVFIHPFSDGNGRTSRLLMNLIMMQAGFPPVIIRRQQRHLYYRCLQVANQGDIRPFIRLIADCAERTIDVYLWATESHVDKLTDHSSERRLAQDPTRVKGHQEDQFSLANHEWMESEIPVDESFHKETVFLEDLDHQLIRGQFRMQSGSSVWDRGSEFTSFESADGVKSHASECFSEESGCDGDSDSSGVSVVSVSDTHELNQMDSSDVER